MACRRIRRAPTRVQINDFATKTKLYAPHTSAGDGRWCGHVIAFGVFAPEDLRFSGFNTMSKLARRAAKVSISEAMANSRANL
jgi:hypothetical protein